MAFGAMRSAPFRSRLPATISWIRYGVCAASDTRRSGICCYEAPTRWSRASRSCPPSRGWWLLQPMVLFLLRAPFRWPMLALFALGDVAAYEYTVMARNYGISMLLIFVFAMLYPRRHRNG